jgi:hypothetical protein
MEEMRTSAQDLAAQHWDAGMVGIRRERLPEYLARVYWLRMAAAQWQNRGQSVAV